MYVGDNKYSYTELKTIYDNPEKVKTLVENKWFDRVSESNFLNYAATFYYGSKSKKSIL